MLRTRDITDVEILSVGKWPGTGCPPGGCAFTEDDLDELVAVYEATKDSVALPLKLGHDDKQKMLQADGYPAAGWLTNIRRVGQKLLADLSKVPEKIADLIDVGAYRNRSVEIDCIECNGTKYPSALTAMALLGADIPAVQGLADITALYASKQIELGDAARAVVFSQEPTPEEDGRRRLMTYVDNAEHVLTDVQAFLERTGDLASLRAKNGRKLSDAHLVRLTSLRDGLRDAESKLGAFLDEPPAPDPDFARVMRARHRAAELRRGELIGA